MLFSKNAESVILYAKGFTSADGELDVDRVFELARDDAHDYARELYHECGEPEQMRAIVDYLTYLYDRHRYGSLKRRIFEVREAFASMPGCSLANLRLASRTRKNLRIFEMGFICALNRQMDVIELHANAGLDRERIAHEMRYSYTDE